MGDLDQSKGPKDSQQDLLKIYYSEGISLYNVSENDQLKLLDEALEMVTEAIGLIDNKFLAGQVRAYHEFLEVHQLEKPIGVIDLRSLNFQKSLEDLFNTFHLQEIEREKIYSLYPELFQTELPPLYAFTLHLAISKDRSSNKLPMEETSFLPFFIKVISPLVLTQSGNMSLVVLLAHISILADFCSAAYAIESKRVRLNDLEKIYTLIITRATIFIKMIREYMTNGSIKAYYSIPELTNYYSSKT